MSRVSEVLSGPRGLNRLARYFLILDGLLAAVTAFLFVRLNLSLAWPTVVPNACMIGLLFAVWLTYVVGPLRGREVMLAESLLATCLLLLFVNIASPAQYPAVALKRPLVDPWLAAADSALGVHVPTLAAWTRAHPAVSAILTLAYFTLLPQFVLPMLLIGLRFKDRSKLWEYLFHFHFCLIITLLGVALLPAECAFSHYGFTSTIDQTRFIREFAALRDGTFKVVRFDDLEGLISMPSFHVAGGLMVTWAFRGHRRYFVSLIALNLGLIAATVMSGAHYFVDILVTLVMFAGSVYAYRALNIDRLTRADEPTAPTASAAVA